MPISQFPSWPGENPIAPADDNRRAPFFSGAMGLAALVAIAGCTPADDAAAPANPASQTEPAPQESPRALQIPDSFEGTAWRVAGADGGRYVTFLDAEGRYRDLKDGEPFHTGAWDRRADGSICFLPDGAETQRRCWTPDRMTDDGRMVVVGGEEGARVELEPGDYEAPSSEESS